MPNAKDLVTSIFPLKVILVGQPGAGKTLLASTFPNPYFLDLDNGMRTLMGMDIEYESIIQDPKRKGAEYMETLIRVNALVEKEMLDPSRTLVLDSLTNLSDMAYADADAKFSGADKRQMWGDVLNKMTIVMKKLRSAKCNVVVTCQEEAREDKITESLVYSPSLYGKSIVRVPYLFDEVYRMYVNAAGKHIIQTDLDSRSICKSRLNRLKLLPKQIEWTWDESNPHSNPIFEYLKKFEETQKAKATKQQ